MYNVSHRCKVDWGDGSEQESMPYDVLTPCHKMHTYPAEIAQYTVVVHYCSQSQSVSSKTAMTCAPFLRTIDVSYDPSHYGDL